MSSYDDSFFDYVNSGATVSARQVIPHLVDVIDIGSVLDVGCGQGAWLSVWRELGVEDVRGVDGDYVNRDRLLIDPGRFSPQDLSSGFDLDRRFDLVQSLEVAEHLPAASAAGFVDSLARHGDVVLFSAAPKGQGGDHHVNEQAYDYWRELFRAKGYVALDYIRPRVKDAREVEPWYRYNTFLYVNEARLSELPQKLIATRVADDRPLRDISPPLYKLRKSLVRLLPVGAMTRVAKIKEQLVTARRSSR